MNSQKEGITEDVRVEEQDSMVIHIKYLSVNDKYNLRGDNPEMECELFSMTSMDVFFNCKSSIFLKYVLVKNYA